MPAVYRLHSIEARIVICGTPAFIGRVLEYFTLLHSTKDQLIRKNLKARYNRVSKKKEFIKEPFVPDTIT